MTKFDAELKNGNVYLVGAGPGDPGLITWKGLRLIQKADVILYDALISPELLRWAKKDGVLVDVGKRGQPSRRQGEINRLLLYYAKRGKQVVRLKGGDPMVFGRVGEEMQALVAAGIPYEVVPGVSSATAAPAYAGIPLTHRDYSSGVAFFTGRKKGDSKSLPDLNWEKISTGVDTLVFLMGVSTLPQIVEKLLQHGRSAKTPAALIQWGTTPSQVTVEGTLSTVVKKSRDAGITSPALLVVGEVITLRKQLAWFEKKPLFGKTILVTRSREQASHLTKVLEERGGQVLECPTIEVKPLSNHHAVDHEIQRLPSYDYLIFTSAHGVSFFFDRLFGLGKDVRALGHLQIAAIGPATAEALHPFGLRADLLPKVEFRQEGLVAALKSIPVRDKRILIPQARGARELIEEELTREGAQVKTVVLYESTIPRKNRSLLHRILSTEKLDFITFASSSAVQHFVAMLPKGRVDFLKRQPNLHGVRIACIGPITADTARSLGLPVHIVAKPYTIPGLVTAMMKV